MKISVTIVQICMTQEYKETEHRETRRTTTAVGTTTTAFFFAMVIVTDRDLCKKKDALVESF